MTPPCGDQSLAVGGEGQGHWVVYPAKSAQTLAGGRVPQLQLPAARIFRGEELAVGGKGETSLVGATHAGTPEGGVRHRLPRLDLDGTHSQGLHPEWDRVLG